MPTKRWHTKSRKGCFACKRKRVKCDERQPICGHCLASTELCIYPSELQHRIDDSNVPSQTLMQDSQAGKKQSLQLGRKKRWHSKSRNSCSNCKQSHIKCDALVPACSNCISRELSCNLNPSTDQLTLQRASGRRIVREELKSLQPALMVASTRQDLLIFHHYTSTVAKLLAREHRMPTAYYTDDVPRIALASDACLHALLGYSAMHHAVLYQTGNRNRTMYTETARRYYHKAIRSAGDFVAPDGIVLPHQSAAMALFCCFTGFTLLLIFKEEHSLEEGDNGDYIATLTSLSRLWKGKSLCQGYSLPTDSEPSFEASHETSSRSETTTRTLLSDTFHSHGHNDDTSAAVLFLNSHLQHLRSASCIGPENDHDFTAAVEVCVEAIEQLRIAWEEYQTNQKVKPILDWPVIARSDLFDLMQNGKAEANAIAICYGLMLSSATSDWHISDFGRGLAQQAVKVVEGSSLTLSPICQWARKRLGCHD